MDIITHALSALICTEPLSPLLREGVVYAHRREQAAVILAAVLPDCDVALLHFADIFSSNEGFYYTTFHRLATHSIPGLIVIALAAAGLAWAWPKPRLAADVCWIKPRWRRLLGLALVGAGMHAVGDWITAWGTLKLLWPFSQADFQLGRVNSIDGILLALTLMGWAMQHFFLMQQRRRVGWMVCGLWFFLCAAYVVVRPWLLGKAFI
jgi:membrane-bound metal-dependent hydrolase YbcI (DUF457 family)